MYNNHRGNASRRALLLMLGGAGAFGVLPAFAATITYTYDELGRLKTATYPTGAVITYSYDAADNRTAVTSTAGGGGGGTLSATASAPGWYLERSGSTRPFTFTPDPPLTITASGGTPPYTYGWQYISGSTIPASDGAGSWNGSAGTGNWTAVWRGTVTDAASAVAYTGNVTVNIYQHVP